MVYGRKNPEDIDESCEQHALDALRYGVTMSRAPGSLDRPVRFLTMKNGVEELKIIFTDRSDLLFRHFENCNVATMRWQRGRNVIEIVNLPGGKGVIVERFELLAWAATSGELIEQFDARLPGWPFETERR
jgi:hypothetical protein